MRYDVGAVWQDPTLLLTLSDMQGALGVCIGFNTFLGPLRFAYGRTFAGKEAAYLSFGFDF
jgi:outer membrane translocation and assembly module TamA